MSVLIAIVLAFYFGGLHRILYDLVSSTGRYGAQTAVRLLGFRHFLKMLKGSSLIWGLGILDSNYPNVKSFMMRDQWSAFYLDDLGIIGGITQFGMLSIFMYGPLFLLGIRACKRSKIEENVTSFGTCLGITVYMIVSCLLLNIFDRQRAFDIPMYIGILAYISQNPQRNSIKW